MSLPEAPPYQRQSLQFFHEQLTDGLPIMISEKLVLVYMYANYLANPMRLYISHMPLHTLYGFIGFLPIYTCRMRTAAVKSTLDVFLNSDIQIFELESLNIFQALLFMLAVLIVSLKFSTAVGANISHAE